jgi:hypothetical protein
VRRSHRSPSSNSPSHTIVPASVISAGADHRFRARAASRVRSVPDRVEQGKPELLGVLLIALHLQHGEPVPLTLRARGC